MAGATVGMRCRGQRAGVGAGRRGGDCAMASLNISLHVKRLISLVFSTFYFQIGALRSNAHSHQKKSAINMQAPAAYKNF